MSDGEHEILFNEPALNALKRHQLQSLSKRYGLKSGGKNVDMINRLQEFSLTLPRGTTLEIPEPASTPGPNILSDSMTDTDTPQVNFDETLIIAHPPISPLLFQPKPRPLSVASDAWEVLSESGASLISPGKRVKNEGSMRSWKSATNGSALNDFGTMDEKLPSSGSMTSIRSMASSLKRSASRNLLPSRSRRASPAPAPELAPQPLPEPADLLEEMVDPTPPSPASTVGVPKRYSALSLQEQPSTVRLVTSPTPSDAFSDNGEDDLPFFGTSKIVQAVKERRSMAPIRSSSSVSSSAQALGRRSMPALANTASFSSIYPPLPAMPPLPASFAKPLLAAPLTMPGSMPAAKPPISPVKSRAPFIFGTPNAKGVSNVEFSEAGKALLAEMNAKLPGGVTFGDELLKGQKAELDKLVKANKVLGEGGWGLTDSVAEGSRDRYAEIHRREFAKMRSISAETTSNQSRKRSGSRVVGIPQSSATPGKRKRCSTPSDIPSAPNGAPMNATVAEPSPKKKRTSYMGTMRDAGKSMMSLAGDENPLKKVFAENLEKTQKQKRRSSLGPGRSIKARFGWLSRKAGLSKAPPATVGANLATTNATPGFFPAPIMPRKTSVYASREPPHGPKPFDLQASLRRSHTSTGPLTSSLTASTFASRQNSVKASTGLSKSTTKTAVSDFGAVSATAPLSINGLSTSKTRSTHSSMRKQSQAEIIKNARTAPPPPVISSCSSSTGLGPPTMKSSASTSRLYAPTASSLARMQATVKPPSIRPLPAIPSAKPLSPPQAFGQASLRENTSFSANFDVSRPLPISSSSLDLKSQPMSVLRAKGNTGVPSSTRSPFKTTSKSKSRQAALGSTTSAGGSGSPMRSRVDMRREAEVQAKRAGIKARQERRGEERELKRMLGE